MKKSVIITLAGTSSRFSRSVGSECHKSFYREAPEDDCLLDWQLDLAKRHGFEQIVLVGGYKYEDLEKFIRDRMTDVNPKMKLVFNEHYHDYGSGYSLLKGIETVSDRADEVTFIEGDLFFGTESIKKIITSKNDVITVNNEPILSNKAVALYFDAQNYPHYIYDTSHSCLEIHEPFTSIYNSGQMWKFTNPSKLRKVCAGLNQKQIEGTNLEIVQRYYGDISSDKLSIVRVEKWYNCNTVSDYREAVKNIIL